MNGFRSPSLICSEVPQRYPQMDMYNDCLRRHGPHHSYLAFIDVDEVRCLPQTIGGYMLPGLLWPVHSAALPACIISHLP